MSNLKQSPIFPTDESSPLSFSDVTIVDTAHCLHYQKRKAELATLAIHRFQSITEAGRVFYSWKAGCDDAVRQ